MTSATVTNPAIKRNALSGLKHFFDSRCGRLGYLGRMILWFFCALMSVPLTIFVILFLADANMPKLVIIMVVALVILLCYFYLAAITVWRLHDMNLSGLWAIYLSMPLVWLWADQKDFYGLDTLALILMLLFHMILLFMPGTQGANQYGDPPIMNTAYRTPPNLARHM